MYLANSARVTCFAPRDPAISVAWLAIYFLLFTGKTPFILWFFVTSAAADETLGLVLFTLTGITSRVFRLFVLAAFAPQAGIFVMLDLAGVAGIVFALFRGTARADEPGRLRTPGVNVFAFS
jgi:hypothetical protein